MFKCFIKASRLLLVMTILLGLGYPLAVTGLAQLVFPDRANGSLLYRDGKIIGSELIGQNFSEEQYFHGRPSGAGADGYDAAASSGTNLGPTNQLLIQTISERIAKIKQENNLGADTRIPADLVTASGSGLDPHLSPEGVLLQIPRVARARGLSEDVVRTLVEKYTEKPQLFILGEPRVNVLKLNSALDQLL